MGVALICAGSGRLVWKRRSSVVSGPSGPVRPVPSGPLRPARSAWPGPVRPARPAGPARPVRHVRSGPPAPSAQPGPPAPARPVPSAPPAPSGTARSGPVRGRGGGGGSSSSGPPSPVCVCVSVCVCVCLCVRASLPIRPVRSGPGEGGGGRAALWPRASRMLVDVWESYSSSLGVAGSARGGLHIWSFPMLQRGVETTRDE